MRFFLLQSEALLLHCLGGSDCDSNGRADHGVVAHAEKAHHLNVRGETIIYMSPDSANDSYGDAFFMQLYKEAGYKPNILCRSSDAESVLIMVAAEEGVSILPDYFTDKLYNADNLSFVPMVGEGEYEEIIAAWRRDSVNPILEQFLEFLCAACPLSEYN